MEVKFACRTFTHQWRALTTSQQNSRMLNVRMFSYALGLCI
ncbi:hypothetical protein SLEP1_g28893 [Rubroshorea leprosula]|uniref:Uncharacterized protein n=1 Tax=Rubroshorea leprosula TaxID=152421 RepID=A0AAV5K4S0_9ROSI|nr:hypothetical protein SLEP1_g28893 [Rubroshorea leprosula]